MTRVIECFEGVPVHQLGWFDLIRYNVALTRAKAASNTYITGMEDNAIFAEYGITFIVVDPIVDSGTQSNVE